MTGLVAATLCATAAWAVDREVERLARSAVVDDRTAAVALLVKDGSSEAVKLLVELARDDSAWVRDAVVVSGDGLAQPEQVKRLLPLAKGRTPLLRRNAADLLGDTRSPLAVPTLCALALDDRDVEVRRAALYALARFEGSEEAAEAAREAFRGADPVMRAIAVYAAHRTKAKDARQTVTAALADPDDRVRSVGLNRLGWIDREASIARLPEAACDPSPRVRATAASLARTFATRECVDVLVALLPDPDVRTAGLAHRSLRELSRKTFDRDPEVWRSWWGGARDSWAPAEQKDRRRFVDDAYATPAEIYGARLATSAVVLLLDVSEPLARRKRGSEETCWQEVRTEVETALGKLPDGTLVNVVTAGDEVAASFPSLQPLDARARKRLLGFLEDVRPRGECDFWGGLSRALDEEAADTVVVVSFGDRSRGEVTHYRRIMTLAQQRYLVSRAVLHTVWLRNTNEKSGDLMRWLADDSGGRAMYREFP